MYGIDTDTPLTSGDLNCLQSQTVDGGNPISFIIRYYKPTTSMTVSEAQDISNHGFQVGAVWEYGNSASYFNYNQGVSDGQTAFDYAGRVMNQPADTPVYFAVDTNSVPKSSVLSYFDGVQQGYDNYVSAMIHQGLTPPAYHIGVYGMNEPTVDVLTWCQNQGIATYFWESASDDAKLFADDNIRQIAHTTKCNGILVDTDESFSNPGFWTI